MKSFLVKIGKAASIMKKNGFLNGGRIVLGYVRDFSKAFSVGSGDILLITGGVGDSAFYRAHNAAEELNFNGFSAAVTIADNPNLIRLIGRFKIFIFHKVIYSAKIEKFIKEIKSQKKEIIFETDDLNYDPQYLPFMEYYQRAGAEEKKLYENGIGREIVEDAYVKIATTTTTYLAKKLDEKGKKVFIVRNKISEAETELCAGIIKKKKPNDGFIRLGYFSGTPSHNKDFATITNALVEVLRNYPKTKLVLVGPLDTDDKLNEFKGRIEVLPRVPREKYYENIFKVDINLAPLALGNPFCEAKSELKFIETGILKVPTVAVANETYSNAIADGVDGYLAATEEDWISKLGKLIEDENLRKAIGEKARKKILERYTTKNGKSEEYYGYLRNELNAK